MMAKQFCGQRILQAKPISDGILRLYNIMFELLKYTKSIQFTIYLLRR